MSRELQIEYAVVGVPRYFRNVLPRLIRSMSRAGANAPAGHFWKYPDADMPRTNKVKYPVPTNEDDWASIGNLGFRKVSFAAPMGEPRISDEVSSHPQISKLRLSPNPAASLSWITALSKGAEMLAQFDSTGQADMWVLLRPDLRISARAMRRLVRNLSVSSDWTEMSVAVAARPYAHKVLHLGEGDENLPIDHFFIGSPRAIRHFTTLGESLEHVLSGHDTRQPLVNEFIVGQFLADNGLNSYPVRLPYFIWRGSWRESIFAAANRSGLGRLKPGLESLIWNVRGFLSPGFHKKSV